MGRIDCSLYVAHGNYNYYIVCCCIHVSANSIRVRSPANKDFLNIVITQPLDISPASCRININNVHCLSLVKFQFSRVSTLLYLVGCVILIEGSVASTQARGGDIEWRGTGLRQGGGDHKHQHKLHVYQLRLINVQKKILRQEVISTSLVVDYLCFIFKFKIFISISFPALCTSWLYIIMNITLHDQGNFTL